MNEHERPPMYIRIGSQRRRTFHTHGIPFRAEQVPAPNMVRVHAWSSSRRILAQTYRDMRAMGLSAFDARSVASNMLLVPR